MPADAADVDQSLADEPVRCQDCDDGEAPVCAWCWICERCIAGPGACGDSCDFRCTAAEADRQRIEDISARLAAATPGPWQYEHGSDLHGADEGAEVHYVTDVVAMADDDPPLCSFYSRADAELVAGAPDDLAFLLGRIADLETRLGNATASSANERH